MNMWLSIAMLFAAPIQPVPTQNCPVGIYALADGDFVDIAPTSGTELRWRRPDGTTGALSPGPDGRWISTLGWTGRADGIRVTFDCARDRIMFDGRPGEQIDFEVKETRFDVDGASLAGRLVMPRGEGPVPIVVLVHGAERVSARDAYALQRMFPAAGIGAFVYDKRGVGGSSGQYTHDYATLATDAIAAVREAKRLGGSRVSRIGFQAGSQGGWVAPLASRIEPVDFIIVSFGLAVSPAAAERELIAAELKREGFGDTEVSQAMEIAQALEVIIDSNFQTGYEQLAAVRARYGNEPWFRHVRGSAAAIMLGMTEEQMRREGPALVPNISLYYDPMPVLRHLDTPQLWILGADDIVAPPGETSRRLGDLARARRPITTAVFGGADHGMYRYELAADGSRISTRAPEGYFPMMRDFILTGRTGTQYGARIVSAPFAKAD
ncbi:alpha/beta hydrolase [Sphingomonas sp.]|uniref:alpha/beta hydrolase family protein n=1 Tax=Sphingomonas sp. TaxID=28214 RepID=UPI0031D93632